MRTRTASLLLGLALASGVAACSNDSDTATEISTGCVDGTIAGSGSTAQGNAMSEWIKAYQTACPDATINYQPVGSGAGITQFIAGNTVFAGSDVPLKETEFVDAQDKCKSTPVHLPMVIGPIAVAFNVQGVNNLNFSSETLAGIFNGTIANWRDPAIKTDNPDALLPDLPIQAFHRSDESGTTDNFTKYLAGTTTWNYETGKAWRAPGGQGAKGSSGVIAAVQQTNGSIGYVEWSYASSLSIPVASLNGVALTNGAVSEAISHATVTNNHNDIIVAVDYKSAGYPLALVTYEITCSNTDDLVKSFFQYTSSDEGQEAITDLQYVPLPSEIQSQVITAVNSLS